MSARDRGGDRERSHSEAGEYSPANHRYPTKLHLTDPSPGPAARTLRSTEAY